MLDQGTHQGENLLHGHHSVITQRRRRRSGVLRERANATAAAAVAVAVVEGIVEREAGNVLAVAVAGLRGKPRGPERFGEVLRRERASGEDEMAGGGAAAVYSQRNGGGGEEEGSVGEKEGEMHGFFRRGFGGRA